MSDVSSIKPDGNVNAIFHTSPRTLQELASIKIAFHIWLEKFAELYPGRNDVYIEIINLEFEPENLIQVPVPVRKMIELWLPVISRELDFWFKGSKHALSYLQLNDIYSRFDLVAFGGNGTVHFKNTIENFFEDKSLNNLTKFEIACVYCIEEKVDFFWPSVCDQIRIEEMQFSHDYSMYYWICRKKGELFRIPLGQFRSIEHQMIDTYSRFPIWLAIEYFLARLDRNDRLEQIARLFNSGTCVKCARYLLPYFEASAQRHVVLMKWIDILTALVERSTSLDFAIQLWFYIKDFITGEQFYHQVIRRFISERNLNRIVYNEKFEYRKVETMLAEIWSNSPGHLKKFILDFHFPNICLEMTKYLYTGGLLKNLSRDISFVLAMLSDADIELRKKFWDETWSKWIMGVSPAHLDQIIALCLVDTEAIEIFKRDLKDKKLWIYYCNTLVTRGFHNELNDLLSYFYTDKKKLLDTKIQLLTTNDHWKNCIFKPKNIEEIQEFVQFVDKLFSNDFLVDDFKNRILSLKHDFKIFCDSDHRFSDIKLIAETVILPEKLEEFKGIFFAFFQNTTGKLYDFCKPNHLDFFNWIGILEKSPYFELYSAGI